jgi:hypothetical protein
MRKFTFKRKTKAKPKFPKDEITPIIQYPENKNYHKTFMGNVTETPVFGYAHAKYNMTPEAAMYYPISFWQFGRRLGGFFRQHKVWASILDWFHLRDNSNFEIGYLYEKDNPNPIAMEQVSKLDFGMLNFLLQRSTVHKQVSRDTEAKLRGNTSNFKSIAIIGIIIIVVVMVMVAISFFMGGGSAAQQVKNVTGAV